MAIISCKRCGKKHSSAASSCMHCGYPKVKKRSVAVKKSVPAPRSVKNTSSSNGGDNTLKNLFMVLVVLLFVTWIVDTIRKKKSYTSNSSSQYVNNQTFPSTNIQTPKKRKVVVVAPIPSNAFRPLVKLVRDDMANPSTFKHVSTTRETVGNTQIITMIYTEIGLSEKEVKKKIKAHVTKDGIIRSVER